MAFATLSLHPYTGLFDFVNYVCWDDTRTVDSYLLETLCMIGRSKIPYLAPVIPSNVHSVPISDTAHYPCMHLYVSGLSEVPETLEKTS